MCDFTARFEGKGMAINDYKTSQGHLSKTHREKGARNKGQGRAAAGQGGYHWPDFHIRINSEKDDNSHHPCPVSIK